MILAKHGIIPPKEWYHDPELRNKANWTVAMFLIKKNIIPPEEWMYDNKHLVKLIRDMP